MFFTTFASLKQSNSAIRRRTVEGSAVGSVQPVAYSRRVVGQIKVDTCIVGEVTSVIIDRDECSRRVGVHCVNQIALGNGIAEAYAEQVVGASGATSAVYQLDSRVRLTSGADIKAKDL